VNFSFVSFTFHGQTIGGRAEGRGASSSLDGSVRWTNIGQEQSAYIHDGVRNIPRLS
jgi:hypothetical protein